jgi:hypothetical protein
MNIHSPLEDTNKMNSVRNKPRLIFFQYRYDNELPEFLLCHFREHVRCLGQSFDVTVINEDCDYQQVCERYQPDATLFETGSNILTNAVRRPRITNVRACSNIPKLGLINADAWCETRAGMLSEMHHLNIDTYFSISTTAAEHTPEIADTLFIWPVFADPDIFRDYGESKLIPVLLTGALASQYPWRNRIHKLLSQQYPSFSCPHPGYLARPAATRALHGVQYARTINASLCAPACGTVANEVVRKHFEIPGCRACLIAEKSHGLEAAGFLDMENCVFGDEHDILDKLDHLFRNPDQLRKITDCGHELVHTRHTHKHRSQILEWVELHKSLRPHERIVQRGPFEGLTVVSQSSGIRSCHVAGEGLHLALLRQGDQKLWAGKHEEAERLYLRCLNYTRSLPEAKFRLALCNLYKGNPKAAADWLCGLLHYTLSEYKAVDPDPVEWGWFIVLLLCLGKTGEAIQRSRQYEWLSHPELDRARQIAQLLADSKASVSPSSDGVPRRRASIHQMPNRTLDEWLSELLVILRTCGKHRLLTTLMESISDATTKHAVEYEKEAPLQPHTESDEARNAEERVPEHLSHASSEVGFSPRLAGSLYVFQLKGFLARIRRVTAERFFASLHHLEKTCGSFLPFRFSVRRNDDFFRTLHDVTKNERIETGLIIGGDSGAGGTEAFLAGIARNANRPVVFCINRSTRRFATLEKRYRNTRLVRSYRMPTVQREQLTHELGKVIKMIRQEHAIASFDAILFNGSMLEEASVLIPEIHKELAHATFVFLDDITNACIHQINGELLKSADHSLVSYNPGVRNGYAIFRRSSAKSNDQQHMSPEAKD